MAALAVIVEVAGDSDGCESAFVELDQPRKVGDGHDDMVKHVSEDLYHPDATHRPAARQAVVVFAQRLKAMAGIEGT